MKVSLIAPLVSLPFFAACSPVMHKPDPLKGVEQEEIATRSHSEEKGEEKQGKLKNTDKESMSVRLQTRGSAKLTAKPTGKSPEASIKKEKKSGLQQALVIYSSELVPIMEPVVTSVGDQGKKKGGAEGNKSSLEEVKERPVRFISQSRWKPGNKGSGVSVSGVMAEIEDPEGIRLEETPPLYFPVQSEQELKEELTALEKTGAWSDSGEEKLEVLSSYGIQCDLPQSFSPVQLKLDVDLLSSIAKGKPSVQPEQKKVSKKLVCDFPVVINKQVEFYLDQFQNRQRTTFKRWLDRSALYLSLIEKELKKAELPEALVYLAMIESGFNPVAYSPARASGLWQFMPGTARSYGLRVDSWVDERRNPEKATTAAIVYLRALYKRFGDWQLAVAAYNAGEGKIQRGLEKYKAKNFWDLADKDYLPLETKRYVPKLIAAIIIANEPERYGFQPVQAKKVQYDVVEVASQTPLATIASAGGYSVQKIRQLNNELLRNKTPQVKGTYSLKVPAGTSTRTVAKLQQIQAREKRKVVHRLRRGETLSGVGKRYNVSASMIMQWNNIANARRIRAGRKLVLYPYGKAGQGTGETGKVEKGVTVSYYKVRNGDSLWSIARKHQVSTQEIKQWNQLNNNLLRPGKKLVIRKS
jgi:membrane-bound lytic murein transglycosylase D